MRNPNRKKKPKHEICRFKVYRCGVFKRVEPVFRNSKKIKDYICMGKKNYENRIYKLGKINIELSLF